LKLSLLYRKARFHAAAEPAGLLRAYLVGLEWLTRRSSCMWAGVSSFVTALESLPGFIRRMRRNPRRLRSSAGVEIVELTAGLLFHRRCGIEQIRQHVLERLLRQRLVGAEARHVRACDDRMGIVDLGVGLFDRVSLVFAVLAVGRKA